MENINLFPLYLSFKTATISTLIGIMVGLPIAYLLSVNKGIVSSLIDTITNIPVVLPPTVLGYYLLVLLGRQSTIGSFLEEKLGIMIVFTPTGAVIAATIVSIPYIIKSSKTAFNEIDKDYIHSARILGRTETNIFFTIIIPIAWRGILSGITMAFVRALGDFGTTLMVSGSIPNKTVTMPIAIYDALQTGNTELVNVLVLIMTTIAVVVLLIINMLEKRIEEN